MTAVEDRLTEITALADAATDGPWRVTPWHDKGVMPAGWADDSLPIDERGPFAHIAASDLLDAAFIAAARAVVPELVAALRAVLALAEGWATQPTDYDEDTEQQIDDGHAVRDAITAALGVTP